MPASGGSGDERIRELQAALRTSEERLRRVLAAMAEGVIVYDAEGRVTGYNDGALRILGATPAIMDGLEPPDPRWRPIASDGSPFDLERKPSRLALQTGQPQFGVLQGIVKPEGTTWISINAQPLLVEGSPVPEGAVVTMTDITESRRMLHALQQSEERSHSIMAAMAEGLVVLDRDLRVIAHNAAAERVFLGPPREVVGVEIAEGVEIVDEQGDPIPLPRRPAATALRERRPVKDVVLGFRRPGGTMRWVSVNAQVVSLPGQGGPGVVATFTDVTERRAAAEERERLQEQLRQAQKMEAVGTLASGIAHDFNNVLAAVLGNVDLAQHDAAPGSLMRERLDEIAAAGERGRALVQRLLTFARRSEPRRHVVRVLPVIEEAVRLVRPLVPPAVTLRLDGDPELAVTCDEAELHQVVLNLCTNAAAAIGAAPGSIGIECFGVPAWGVPPTVRELAPEASSWVSLAVTDDGCGMDAETRSRIFDPFFTTRPGAGGTGLGLSVVHGIVTSLRGRVTVLSEPGGGSHFEVLLPAAEVAPDEPRPVERLREAPPLGAGSVELLFVDDEPSLVLLGRAALERGGFRVAAFEDPVAALAEFESRPADFGLVVTDVLMPALSGLELASRVRALRPDLPIMLTSALETLVPEEELARLAPARLAAKPWSHVGLVDAVRDMLPSSG